MILQNIFKAIHEQDDCAVALVFVIANAPLPEGRNE